MRNTLQHMATHWNTSAKHCNIMQHTIMQHTTLSHQGCGCFSCLLTSVSVHCNTLQPICNTPQHTATHHTIYTRTMGVCDVLVAHYANYNLQHLKHIYNSLQRTAKRCNAMQHTATHCKRLQHTATHLQHICNPLQHTTLSISLPWVSAMYCSLTTLTTACNTLQQICKKI